MIPTADIESTLIRVHSDYLTHRDRYRGQTLPQAQAAALTTQLHTRQMPLPDLTRRLILLQILVETAADRHRPWPQLIRAACGYSSYSGHPAPAEAEYATMGPAPLTQLLNPEPASQPRLVWPYCPQPHAGGHPHRLTRTPHGWACDGITPSGQPCRYVTSQAGQPALDYQQ